MKIASALMLFSLMNTPQGYNDRRIIVISASELNDEVENQIEKLRDHNEALMERRLAVYTVIGDEVQSIYNSSQESKKLVNGNKSEYQTTSIPKIYLIGLDRTTKKTFSKFARPKEIFDIVDSMPMRKAEMRRND